MAPLANVTDTHLVAGCQRGCHAIQIAARPLAAFGAHALGDVDGRDER